jgi:hypothetical protein
MMVGSDYLHLELEEDGSADSFASLPVHALAILGHTEERLLGSPVTSVMANSLLHLLQDKITNTISLEYMQVTYSGI